MNPLVPDMAYIAVLAASVMNLILELVALFLLGMSKSINSKWPYVAAIMLLPIAGPVMTFARLRTNSTSYSER